jgi:hypothetical protein
MSDLAWWLQHFERSAFRLETLPVYDVPQETEMVAAFCRGEKVRLPDNHPWLERLRAAARAGKAMQRVRVVSHPLSDYLRFELSLYPRSIEAGEDVRIANLDSHPELEVCRHDFWLFDDQVVVTLEYDPGGRFRGTRTEQDLDRYRQLRELALSCSMELSAYTTRAARR